MRQKKKVVFVSAAIFAQHDERDVLPKLRRVFEVEAYRDIYGLLKGQRGKPKADAYVISLNMYWVHPNRKGELDKRFLPHGVGPVLSEADRRKWSADFDDEGGRTVLDSLLTKGYAQKTFVLCCSAPEWQRKQFALLPPRHWVDRDYDLATVISEALWSPED